MMKHKILFGVWLFVTINTVLYPQSGWVQQFTIQNVEFTDIAFINQYSGTVISSNGRIFHTSNGGGNWIEVVSGVNDYLWAITYINAQKGFIVGGTTLLLKTTNSGQSWIRDSLSVIGCTSDISFANMNCGLICGGYYSNEIIGRTTNGGENWTFQVIPTSYYFSCITSIVLVDSLIGYAVSRETPIDAGQGRILKTTNGGINWFVQLSITGYDFGDVCFLNNSTGFVSGIYTLYYTSNGGYSWINKSSSVYANALWEMSLTNINRLYIATSKYGNAEIILSSNQGNSWQSQYFHSGTYNRFHTISFISDSIGWAAGYFDGNIGVILKTTNGGEPIGIKHIGSEVPALFSLSQNYPNPFNPITKIKFDVPLDSRLRGNDNVTLRIYDALGREAAVLVDEQLSPGTYEAEWDASNNPSGVYFYKLTAGDYSDTKKIVLIK